MKTRILSTARLSFALASAIAALLAAPAAHAATTGFNLDTAGPHDYNTVGNWASSTIDGTWDSSLTLSAAQTVTFGADTVLTTGWAFNYDGNQTLTLRGTVANRTVTLGGDISVNPVADQTITIGSATANQNLNVNLGGVTRTATVSANKGLTLVNVLSTGALTKLGTGTLTLSGANTFSGQLSVENGTLSIASINNDSANGTLGNNALSVILGSTGAQTGTLRYTGATASSTKKFTMATDGTGAFDVTTGANTLTLTGLIDGGGGLTKIGAGTLLLPGTNTYTGATTVNAGTLKLDFSAAGAPTTNIIISSSALVLGGGTLNLTGKASTTNSQAVNGTTINAGLSAVTLTANATANPLSLDLGAITRNVGSTLRITQPIGTLSGSNGLKTTSGSAGAILLQDGVAYATIGTTDWAGKDATNTWIAPPNYTAYTATTLSGNATMDNASAAVNTTTLSSITTINSLRIAGSRGGTVNINAGSTLTTGGILLSSGVDSNGTASFINGPGSLMGPAGQDLVVIQNQGVGKYPLTIAAPIVDNGSATGLTYDSVGNVLSLTGNNTYTGTTRILSGAIQIGLGGTSGSLHPDSQIVNNGSLILNRSDDITFSNNISGPGSLTKTGAGKLLLSGNNTYSGGTTVSAGTLQIGADTALGSGTLFLNGGAIEASGASRTITGNVSFITNSSVVGSQDVTFASGFSINYVGTNTLTNNLDAGKTLTINGTVPIKRQNSVATVGFSGTGSTVISGIISQGDTSNPATLGNLTKSGTGTLTFSGTSPNTYNGLTTVSAGTLALAKLNGVSGVQAIPAALTIGGADNTAATVQYAASTTNPDMMGTGVVTLNGRGILDFNGATDTIGAVAIVSTGATTTNPTPIINTAGGGNLTIGTLGITPVAGFTSVVNAGTGTLTLGGDVTFTAATTGQAQITGTALSWGVANRNFIVGLGTGAGHDLLIDAQITGARSLTKSGAGRLALANTNTYTLGTTVSAGSLLLSGAFDMPTTGTLAVSAGGAFSLADGTVRATNGATTGVGLTLATGSLLSFDWNGVSLDSFTTLGTATATGAVAININNTSPTGSGGTLITAAVGSTLNGATYLLANNTNYTATISSTETTVSIGAQTPATALTDAYWRGNQVAGFTGTMTVSTGTLSNWASDAAGTASGLTPGSTTNMIFGATDATLQASVITGLSDMSVNSITFNDSAAVTIAASPNTITLNSTSGTAATTSGALATVTAGSAISVTQYSSTTTNTNTISANLALGANQTWNVASGKTLAVSGIVTGTGSLTLADAGTVTLSANNTYTGTTTISAGTLQLGNGGATGSLSPSSAITNNGNLTINRSDNVAQGTIFASTISGSGSLTKSGAGTLTLPGTNTYMGGTVINGGTLSIASNASLGELTAPLTLNANATLPNSINYGTRPVVLNNGAIFFGLGISSMTIGGPISGDGGFQVSNSGPQAGSGTVNLTNTGNTFTGPLVLAGGNYSPAFNVASIGDAPGAGQIQFAGGTSAGGFRVTGGSSPIVLNYRQFALSYPFHTPSISNNNSSDANTLTVNTDLVVTATGNLSVVLGGSNTGTNTFAGLIANGPASVISVTKSGTGTWILSGTNTYTGATTISSGTLVIPSIDNVANANPLGKSANTAGNLILNGGTLRYTGAAANTDRLFSLQVTSSIDSSGSGAINFTNTGSMGFNAGTAAKTLTLTGTNTGNNTIAAVIGNNTGATAITKSGIGTWTLSGTNTYTGATTVSGGTLLVNSPGSLHASSAVAVNGGTLGGTGIIGGTVTVAAAGSVAPGASAGTLSIGGGLTFTVTSGDVGTLNYELGPIAASDKIAVGGTLNIGTAALDLNDFVFTNLGGLQNGTYPLIETNSVITGTLGGVTNGTLGSATIVLQKSADNTDIELVVSGLGGGTAYQTWATGNEPFDGDANGDGVKDGLAFLLGAVNPSENAIGRLPTVSQVGGNLILNFNCLPIAARGTATLKVAHSTNLGSWTTTTDVVPDADDAVPDNNVTFVVGAGPVGPPALKSVTATIGSAAAAGGKLFGRLEANQP